MDVAKVSIWHRYPDDEIISIDVEGKTNFPDALDEMRATAVRMHAEVVNEARDFTSADETD